MIEATEHAVKVTDEVIASYIHLHGRVEEMEKRYESIPLGDSRRVVFKLMLDDGKRRLDVQRDKVILLCWRWGLNPERIAARVMVEVGVVTKVIADNPGCRRLGAMGEGVFYA